MAKVEHISDICFHYVIGDEYLVIDMERNGKTRHLPVKKGFFHILFLNCPMLPLYWKQYRIAISLTGCVILSLVLGKMLEQL